MTADRHDQNRDSTAAELVRRRRAASRRLPPTPSGWRDPLDRLARDRAPAPRPRRPFAPFRYLDRDGNVRDQTGTVLLSRLDVLLDADPSTVPPDAETPVAVPTPRRATDGAPMRQGAAEARGRGCAA